MSHQPYVTPWARAELRRLNLAVPLMSDDLSGSISGQGPRGPWLVRITTDMPDERGESVPVELDRMTFADMRRIVDEWQW